MWCTFSVPSHVAIQEMVHCYATYLKMAQSKTKSIGWHTTLKLVKDDLVMNLVDHGVECINATVITGATDGIGKAYAQELANLGLNVVLISRNPEKLSDVAKEIEGQSKVKTKCVAVDFSGGPEIYQKIRKEIGDLEVGVLVNNVGMAYTYPEFLTKLTDETLVRNLVTVNITSVLEMTRIILPGMEERRRGVIINIASASAIRATPLLSIYSGAKAFVDLFSQSINLEVKNKGIIVQSVLPYFVATKLSGIRRTSLFVPSPTLFAKAALGTVGQTVRTCGCLAHAIQGYVIGSLPDFLYNAVAIKPLLVARARALKKLQKSQ